MKNGRRRRRREAAAAATTPTPIPTPTITCVMKSNHISKLSLVIVANKTGLCFKNFKNITML